MDTQKEEVELCRYLAHKGKHRHQEDNHEADQEVDA